MSSTVAIDVLGPLRLTVDGRPVAVPGHKRRAVLALLALAEGRAVTVDDLVDGLWPDDPPASCRAAVHSHISRLRGHLGPAAGCLQTLDGAYRLALDRGALDVVGARRLLASARAAEQTDPGGAAALVREARALWRGPPLAELRDVAAVAAAAVGLERLGRDVTELLIRCSIAGGELEGITGLAAEAVAADPLAEPAVRQLIEALARTGRGARALETARDFRRRLVEETGLDPSPALDELERAVAGGDLGQGPAIAAPGPAPPAAVGPSPGTPLVGRQVQLVELQRLLVGERLVTVVGPGGIGKTRLALEVARSAAAPVLRLAPVTDPAAVPHALAAVLGLHVVRGDVLTACAAALGTGPRLLVVDNCEHLLDAVRDTVRTVLERCPGLTVLATGREPLGLAAECPFRLGGLAVPAPGDEIPGRSPAVALFLDRARRVRPGFAPDEEELDLVAEIVRRLGGMPLAVELAAGRLSTFSTGDLAARLDRALDLLGSGRTTADPRHRTLRDTVAWSYQLLTDDARRLFRHLSVFADGVDLATAEAVAVDLGLPADPGSVLAHLVDASMVEVAFEDHPRYRMLEPLRAFGLDRLAAAGETSAAQARLVRWAVDLTAWIDATIVSDREPEADAVLRRELPNLRAAWRLARRGPALDDAVALVVALHDALDWRDLTEAWSWPEELAGDPALAEHPRAAEVLGVAAGISYLRGDHRRADAQARTGLAGATGPRGSWLCLTSLAEADMARGAYREALDHSLAADALATRPTENLGVAALAAAYAGDLDRAASLVAALDARAGSPGLHGFASYVAGEIHSVAGRPERAEQCYRLAVDRARRSGATFLHGIAAVGLAGVHAARGRCAEALDGYRDAIEYWATAGNWTHQWVTLRNLADLLRRLDDPETAAVLDAAADLAPDAPAGHGGDGATATEHLGRDAALEVARRAVARHLGTRPPSRVGWEPITAPQVPSGRRSPSRPRARRPW
ncbi:BTAD domain-containing putative transcriptional regulator [Pseudonocardia sp. RS010]|uniref:BTAD domain-containing putative transcriptional regulator n=1 Tax=Pseudonocardia sp. RS010 TaxID=3385979 RepID=UPI0039A2C792